MTTIDIIAARSPQPIAVRSPKPIAVRSETRRQRMVPLPADEHQLVRLLQQRDPRAIAEIWTRHSSAVLATAVRIVRNEALAREIAQEVFTTLWQQSNRVDFQRGTLKTFLHVLTHHRAVDVIRHETARRIRDERFHADRCNTATVSSPDEIVPIVVSVRAAVAALPLREREVIELAFFGGRSYREVATDLCIPEGTAKSRLRNGLRRLEGALSTSDEFNTSQRAS